MAYVGESSTTNQYVYVCDEMWVEILSRLSIKSLLVCQSVCKNWRNIIHYLMKKILVNPQSLPTIGLILVDMPANFITKYICIKTGEIMNVQYNNTLDKRIVVGSGYEKGLLSDFCLDFSALKTRIFFSGKPGYITLHQGLILSTHACGTYRVHNPVTKEMYAVPTPDNAQHHIYWPIGMIIAFPTLPGFKCEFIVVTLLPIFSKSIGVYCSETCKWERFKWEGLDNLRLHQPIHFVPFLNGMLRYYVAIVDGSDSNLFFMTRNCLVAIKFKGKKAPQIADEYVLPLPEPAVVRDFNVSRKLWDCGGNLQLACHSSVHGLNIWKHPKEYSSAEADMCAWIPLVNISNSISLQIKSAVGGNHNVPIISLACIPDVGAMYFLVESSVFVYDPTNDILHKVGEIHDDVNRGPVNPPRLLLLKPCFSSLNALKSTPT